MYAIGVSHTRRVTARKPSLNFTLFIIAAKRARVRENPIIMRETLLLALLSTVAALRVGTSGLSRRAAIAGGAAVTLLPPPGFASSGSMAGKTVLIVRWPQVEPPSLHATSD